MPEVPDTVDDAIEPLSSPTTDQVFEATRPFSAREIASAAVSEAHSGGGGASVVAGFMANAIHNFDGVAASWGENTEPKWFALYDTDGFVAAAPGQTSDYLDQIVIPAGLDGMYELSAVIYIVENESDPGLTQATFILDDPTNSGDFDVRSSLVQEFVGDISLTRPLIEGDTVQIKIATIAGADSLVLKGGDWNTDPENPDGPGITLATIEFSLFTVTRIGDLPEGFDRGY